MSKQKRDSRGRFAGGGGGSSGGSGKYAPTHPKVLAAAKRFGVGSPQYKDAQRSIKAAGIQAKSVARGAHKQNGIGSWSKHISSNPRVVPNPVGRKISK